MQACKNLTNHWKNNQQKMKRTTLIDAASIGDEQTVGRLLNRKVTVNKCNSEGNTAIMMAAQNGHSKIVELLHLRNADITLTNIAGKSAYDLAEKSGHHDLAKRIRMMQVVQTALLGGDIPSEYTQGEEKREFKEYNEKYNK
jgi:ankyrin repeat protein